MNVLYDALEKAVAEIERSVQGNPVAAYGRGVLATWGQAPKSEDAAGGNSLPSPAYYGKVGRAGRAGRPRARIDVPRAIELYTSGQPLLAVAIELGHDDQAVRRALVEAGVTIRNKGARGRRKEGDERLERMKALRDAGATLEEIALSEHITRERVRQLFLVAGFPRGRAPMTAAEKDAVARYVSGDSMLTAAAPAQFSALSDAGRLPKTYEELFKDALDRRGRVVKNTSMALEA